MADRPILFSAPMVQALLAGRKRQTRRILPNSEAVKEVRRPDNSTWEFVYDKKPDERLVKPPRIDVGDRLYVREHWRTDKAFDGFSPAKSHNGKPVLPVGSPIAFDADEPLPNWIGKNRQGMHMPRWASRLTLMVTGVKVERLQDISQEDAKAEGIEDGGCLNCGNSSFPSPCGCEKPEPNFADSYFYLWDSINGPGSSALNPWVVAYTFNVHRGNIDQIARAA